MEEELPLLSVVVPIYNTPRELLRRCFESIDAQSYERLEIIFVDDGSESDYRDLWEELNAITSKGVVVVRQDNKGVSAARNRGIEEARGSLVTFVDPDDELADCCCLGKAVNVLLERGVDIVFGRVSYCFEAVSFDTAFGFGDGGVRVFSAQKEREDFEDFFLSYGKRRGSVVPAGLNRGPVARVFKKSVLDRVRFDEQLWYAEDAVFNAQAVMACTSIALVDAVWYRYYQYASSAAHASKLSSLEAHCGRVRALIPAERLEAAYWSHCRHCILEACVNDIRAGGRISCAAVKDFVSSGWAQRALSGFDGELYEIPSWEKMLVFLAQTGRYRLFLLGIMVGVRYLDVRQKKPIEMPR